MKAVAVIAPGQVRVVDIPAPQIRDYECLVKVQACGFCNSTDLKTIDDELSAPVPFPIILGHEGVGQVVEVGAKVRNIKLGERFLNPHGRLDANSPYRRHWANMVEYALVQDWEVMQELGVDKKEWGGWAAKRVPPELSPEDAGVLLSLKENYSALGNFGFREGMDVLVYGDGPVGLGLIQFMRLGSGGFLVVVGHRQQRLERIGRLGKPDLTINAHQQDVEQVLGERRFDLVIDAVGSTAIIRQGARRLKPGGKIGLYGVLRKSDTQFNLLDLPNHAMLHILNYPYREQDAHDQVVRLVLDGKINPKDFYTHILPMTEVAHAVELIRSREAFKVVLKV